MCVRVCVHVLHNSKTIKPSSLKLCMHTKKTPRKCMSENWVSVSMKTHLLKIMAEFTYILYQAHPRSPLSVGS